MRQLKLSANPFKVFTPEDMDADDVNALFVDPFTDFNKIRDPGHTMVNGPRGCGKSMIFRYLLADCQRLALQKPIRDLPFLAFLISIKNAGPTPSITELRRLRDPHADIVLNEHVLTIFVASKVFSAVAKLDLPTDDACAREARAYFEEEFARRLVACGGTAPTLKLESRTPSQIFNEITNVFDGLFGDIVQYARRVIATEPNPYTGALCGYSDFLYPLLQELRDLSFLPSGPCYLLLDDADYLNRTQTIVLNSWVSTRTQRDVSIKISTQLQYKTHATVAGLPIQSPHDFQAINISDIYTTHRGRYLNRVGEIITKRLQRWAKQEELASAPGPRDFFPEDEEQEAAIQAIAARIRADFPESGRGARADDDVARYARPEYIRSLGGIAKSTNTYNYAGFEQLVHISSGLVRYFLEPAALMFDEQRSRRPDERLMCVEPAIQDEVIRAAADNLMFSEFDIIRKEVAAQHEHEESPRMELDAVHRQMDKLRNLICALGGAFYLKLVSNDAERRVFSVAISGDADSEVLEVFELGVRCGYFHRSSIGNKDGTGRTRLYVLTRRLAPYFKLDPSSFAGYLWVTGDALRAAMRNPDALLRRIKKRGVSEFFEANQLTLFD